MTTSSFQQVILSGVDVRKFLQGQITASMNDVSSLTTDAIESKQQKWLATAICNLKGRIDFGIWLRQQDLETFHVVIHHSCTADFVAHVKKYGAFSKFTVSEPTDIYPCIIDDLASFSEDASTHDFIAWQQVSIATGNYWITKDSQFAFQPQELRLHQRAGVSYNKGCYLGQEVIARIYFRSAPRAYLHRVSFEFTTAENDKTMQVPKISSKTGVNNKVHIVNSIATESGYEALVVARDNHLEGFTILDLPKALQEDVARKV